MIWKYTIKSRSGNVGPKLGKSIFIRRGLKFKILWDFIFSSFLYDHYKYSVKIWAKINSNSWSYSTFNFEAFEQKILIFNQRAVPQCPYVLIATTYKHKILKCFIMLKLKSFKSLHTCTSTVSNKIYPLPPE